MLALFLCIGSRPVSEATGPLYLCAGQSGGDGVDARVLAEPFQWQFTSKFRFKFLLSPAVRSLRRSDVFTLWKTSPKMITFVSSSLPFHSATNNSAFPFFPRKKKKKKNDGPFNVFTHTLTFSGVVLC